MRPGILVLSQDRHRFVVKTSWKIISSSVTTIFIHGCSKTKNITFPSVMIIIYLYRTNVALNNISMLWSILLQNTLYIGLLNYWWTNVNAKNWTIKSIIVLAFCCAKHCTNIRFKQWSTNCYLHCTNIRKKLIKLGF